MARLKTRPRPVAWRPMKALVTGVAGFIGSHLAEALLELGWDVLGVDSFSDYYPRGEKERNLSGLTGRSGFTFHEADLVDCSLFEWMEGRDRVFHLAAQPGVRRSFDEFARYTRDNLLATERVFAAALSAGVARVVWASSSSVYGDSSTYPCPEDAPTEPKSPYGVTKLACENLAGVYRALGLATVGLRYFTVYGPRQRPDMAFRRICEAVYSERPFTIFGDGCQSRDFTFVDDAVDATIRAAVTPGPVSPIYNVGGGHEASLNEVLALIQGFADGRPSLVRGSEEAGDVRRTAADTSRARRELGWAPTVSLREGLRAELAWTRASRIPSP